MHSIRSICETNFEAAKCLVPAQMHSRSIGTLRTRVLERCQSKMGFLPAKWLWGPMQQTQHRLLQANCRAFPNLMLMVQSHACLSPARMHCLLLAIWLQVKLPPSDSQISCVHSNVVMALGLALLWLQPLYQSGTFGGMRHLACVAVPKSMTWAVGHSRHHWLVFLQPQFQRQLCLQRPQIPHFALLVSLLEPQFLLKSVSCQCLPLEDRVPQAAVHCL